MYLDLYIIGLTLNSNNLNKIKLKWINKNNNKIKFKKE
jgi:hypothetical protein